MSRLSPLFTWRSAIAESDLPSMARLVAYGLSLHMSERGDSCFPSQTRLAKETGLSRTGVKDALRLLEKAGYLFVTRSGNRSTNDYAAVIPGRIGSPGDPMDANGVVRRPTWGREATITGSSGDHKDDSYHDSESVATSLQNLRALKRSLIATSS